MSNIQERTAVGQDRAAIKAAIKEFDKALSAERDFGACDTEPRSVARRVMREIFEERRAPRVPDSAARWQLYRELDGADEAAARLTKALDALIAVANNAPDKVTEEIFGGDWWI